MTRFDFILPVITLLTLVVFLHWYSRTAFRLKDFFQREIIVPLNELSRSGDINFESHPASEVLVIGRNLTELKVRLIESQRKISSSEKDAAMGRLAAQVAHDIRSPLAALKAIGAGMNPDPMELKQIYESSLDRLESIAHSLLEQGKRTPNPTPLPLWPLRQLIQNLITEKKTSLGFNSSILFELIDNSENFSEQMTCKNGSDFQRILSNLIGNSIDSISHKGLIRVKIQRSDMGIEVEVEDSGSGIPEHILPRLMERGATFGKEKGSGLGLHHAAETLKSWGGSITISSTPGKGTRVRLFIPHSQLIETIGAAGIGVMAT